MNSENKQKLNNTKNTFIKSQKTMIINQTERNSDGERFAQLAKYGEIVFHSDDLANLWNIRNKNTLHKTLSRYTKRGLIHRVYKGLYSIKNLNELDQYLIGIKFLHRPAYISCESVLFEKGILNQKPQVITLVSSVSKSFSVGQINYRSRQMRDEYLFNDYGIITVDGVRKASLSRAIVDMLYFNRNKYFDSLDSKLINWTEVKNIIKNIGYKIKL
jgi:predicted transcriptional regulator of viral defense system